MPNETPLRPVVSPRGRDELALASVACGVGGIVLAILLGIVGVVIGVVALVLARAARAKAARRNLSPWPAALGTFTAWVAVVVGVGNILIAVARWE